MQLLMMKRLRGDCILSRQALMSRLLPNWKVADSNDLSLYHLVSHSFKWYHNIVQVESYHEQILWWRLWR